ncbi:hypothetical protein LINPERHAP2_LOCUS23562, partial [Linum perenne]
HIVWDLGFRKINLQADSLAAVEAINAKESSVGRHTRAIRTIQEWLSRSWDVHISHIFREGNRPADLLAHVGHCLLLGTHLNCSLSSNIAYAILSDCIGVSFPRSSHVIN